MPLHPVSLGRDHTSLAYCCGWNMKCPWLLTLGTLWSLPSGATGRSGSLGWASRLDGPARLPASLRFHECVAVGPAGLLLRPPCPPCLLPCLAHHIPPRTTSPNKPFLPYVALPGCSTIRNREATKTLTHFDFTSKNAVLVETKRFLDNIEGLNIPEAISTQTGQKLVVFHSWSSRSPVCVRQCCLIKPHQRVV